MRNKTFFITTVLSISLSVFSVFGMELLHQRFDRKNLPLLKNIINHLLASGCPTPKEKIGFIEFALSILDPIFAKKILKSDLKIINEKSKYGCTFLHYLVKYPAFYSESLTLDLLEKGANPNILNDEGYSALQQAFIKNQKKYSPYIQESIDVFMNHPSNNINQQSKNKKTLLHYAIIYSDVEIIKKILKRNANTNLQDENGNTVLHSLAEYPISICMAIAAQLLAFGAEPNVTNNNGLSPLLLILQAKYHYKYRLEAVDLKNNLFYQDFFDETLDVLINNPNTDLEIANPMNGKIALHYAAEFGDFKILSRLLKPGVNIDILDKQGMTPLNYVRKENKNKSRERDYAISIKLLSDYTQQDNIELKKPHLNNYFSRFCKVGNHKEKLKDFGFVLPGSYCNILDFVLNKKK
ncbi:MAG: ankyrin repeat domain-containing protein [Candidatus Babeliales bacterium]